MTSTPPEAPSGPSAGSPHDGGPRVTTDEMRDLGRLRRSASDRKVAGVAGGLARHLDVDPLVLRVAFVVLVFFGGAGLILYGACWLLVPDEATGRAAVTLDERSRTLALLVGGAIAAFALIGDSWGVFWFPWPLAIIALIVLFFVTRGNRSQPPAGSAPPPGWVPPPGQPPAPSPTEQGPAGAPPTAAPAAPPTTPAASSETGSAATPPTSGYTPQPEQWNAPGYPGYTGYTASVAPETYGGHTAPLPPVQQAPRDPRRRGPILFWFTLALIALGIGVLGMVDVAGADVSNSAYPALAVGIIGVMLLVGAFFGRAGGLILIGLIGTMALAGTTAADEWDGTKIHSTPQLAAGVQSSYDFRTGELVLDLTEISDLSNLDGRTIDIEGNVGRIDVIVPDGLDVEATGQVNGPGDVSLFGEHTSGIDSKSTERHDGGTTAPQITIDARVDVGEITVDTP